MTTRSPGLPPQAIDLQRKLIELQRLAFESSFDAVSTIQDRQAELLQGLVEQLPGMPAEVGEAMERWTEGFQRARQEYHDSAERSYELLDQVLDRLAAGSTTPGVEDEGEGEDG
ncbi:MAG TPA: hypothetical protein VMV46_08035 [Thermoanaerobaculia bacterium]|nr:hypothetical protein [Thermoanaerobaculia bacterium]